MRQLFAPLVFVFIVGFASTAAYQRVPNEKTGSINILLRSKRSSSFDELTNGLEKMEEKGGLQQWKKAGGENQAFDDFMSIDGKVEPEEDKSANGKITFVKRLKDGSKVIMRDHSSQGYPTLELQHGDGNSKSKAIRYHD